MAATVSKMGITTDISAHILGYEVDNDVEETPLYRAQEMAKKVVQPTLFPCYASEYVDSLTGLHGKVIWCYSKVYDAVWSIHNALCILMNGVQYVAFLILPSFNTLQKAFEPMTRTIQPWVQPVIDTLYPYNPINGHRQLTLIPRKIEKALGEYVFYPMSTWGINETHECLPSESTLLAGQRRSIAQRVNDVCNRLKHNNPDLLNPKSETTQFEYQAKTFNSTQLNAFATPGGGIAVFSQLIKEIDGAIESTAIQESTFQFADGSAVSVDLTGVTRDDVIAALLGHEMTHAAARHSICSMVASGIRSAILFAARMLSISYLKSLDIEYQNLSRKPSQLTVFQKETLVEKEMFYDRLNSILDWIENKIKSLSGLFASRQHEYEADVTGVYMANRAGYNPLGAIYLQELLRQKENWVSGWLHDHVEFMFSHPNATHRLRAIFAAIYEIDRSKLTERTGWNMFVHNAYNMDYSNQAIRYARERAPIAHI